MWLLLPISFFFLFFVFVELVFVLEVVPFFLVLVLVLVVVIFVGEFEFERIDAGDREGLATLTAGYAVALVGLGFVDVEIRVTFWAGRHKAPRASDYSL